MMYRKHDLLYCALSAVLQLGVEVIALCLLLDHFALQHFEPHQLDSKRGPCLFVQTMDTSVPFSSSPHIPHVASLRIETQKDTGHTRRMIPALYCSSANNRATDWNGTLSGGGGEAPSSGALPTEASPPSTTARATK